MYRQFVACRGKRLLAGPGSSPSKLRKQTRKIETRDQCTIFCRDNCKTEEVYVHLPIRFVFDFVQIFPALLTEIFVGTCRLIHDSDAATMLPDFAEITLDEHAADFVCKRVRWVKGALDGLQLDGAATESLATRLRQTWIFLLSTETPSYFFLLIIEVFVIFVAGIVVIVIVGALALPRLWQVFRSGFSIIDGLRPVTGRSVGGGIFMVRSCAPLSSVRIGGAGGGVGVLRESRRGLGRASPRGTTG